jgi:hypothetical protein
MGAFNEAEKQRALEQGIQQTPVEGPRSTANAKPSTEAAARKRSAAAKKAAATRRRNAKRSSGSKKRK